jgi:hypothetical protein
MQPRVRSGSPAEVGPAEDLWTVDDASEASSDDGRVPRMTRAFAAAAADMLLEPFSQTLEILPALAFARGVDPCGSFKGDDRDIVRLPARRR